MRYLIILFFLINVTAMAQKKQIQELPFKSIPEASKNYESGNIVVRMIEGLGYRYYWATEGLQTGDLDYKPSDSGQSTKETLKHIHNEYGKIWELYFANGGDQDNNSIPESSICDELGINLLDGLGDKIQSSSWLLKSKNK